MSADHSITCWLTLFEQGDERAAQALWERYFQQLVSLARAKLGTATRRAADEEDVALSAFHSLWEGATAGRFPNLADRDDIWRLLVVITARKAQKLVLHERRQKRGGGQVRSEASLSPPTDDDSPPGMAQIVGESPSPDFALQVAEQCQRLLQALPEDLRRIALWKFAGHTNAEIARLISRGERAVERKLFLIRRTWTELPAEE
jgi:DNA-directed RNA polymerase specialized sigma24 family protein